MYLIGYDIGSSSIKAALVEAQSQKVLGVIQYPDHEMEMISRQKGWAEQLPEIWWRNLCLCTNKLIRAHNIKAKDIISIGISYQMHGLVAVDKDYNVLRPSIIWCDSRAVSIGDQAFREMGVNYCLNNFLNSPGNFTASKLKWVKDNEPEIYNRIHKIMLPGEYITMKLTGRISTSISGLSEGILWNFKKKKIANDVLEYYDLNPELLPEITGTFDQVGTVTKASL